MTYATIDDLKDYGIIVEDETQASALINEASVLVDSYNEDADEEKKKIVICRIIKRAYAPIDSWADNDFSTITVGRTTELYIGRTEKKLLGVSGVIGASNPYSESTEED